MIWTGNKLRELRKRLNVTAKVLGNRIGYSRAKSVYEAESKGENEIRMPVSILLDYINKYGIDYVVMSQYDLTCIIQMMMRIRNILDRFEDQELVDLMEISIEKVEYNLNGKYSEKY